MAILSWPKRFDLIVFDFDGVMTDNTVYVDRRGRESVRCNRADGLGIDLLRAAAVPMMILSTEKNRVVAERAKKLRIPCFHGIDDKLAFLQKHLKKKGIGKENTAYVGNDVNDLPCMRFVGFPVAVADAHPDVRATAKILLKKKGGDGAVREFCDLVLKNTKHR